MNNRFVKQFKQFIYLANLLLDKEKEQIQDLYSVPFIKE